MATTYCMPCHVKLQIYQKWNKTLRDYYYYLLDSDAAATQIKQTESSDEPDKTPAPAKGKKVGSQPSRKSCRLTSLKRKMTKDADEDEEKPIEASD